MNLLQSYGGDMITTFNRQDKRLVKDLRRVESMISSVVPPSLWIVKRDFIIKVRDVCEIADKLRFAIIIIFYLFSMIGDLVKPI